MTAIPMPLVMVVDDDPRSRELMTLVMRHAGYGVIVADDAQQAISLLATARPALALVDYLMPGMHGLDLCRWVRTQPELASLRFVLLTGMDTDQAAAEARVAGADAVITKPFDRLELLERLNTLLEPPAAE